MNQSRLAAALFPPFPCDALLTRKRWFYPTLKDMKNIITGCFALLLMSAGPAAFAQNDVTTEQADEQLARWEESLDELELELEDVEIDEVKAAVIKEKANASRTEAQSCIAAETAKIEQLESDLTLLGEDPIEPDELAAGENDLGDQEIEEQADDFYLRRLAMTNSITQLTVRVKECRFLILRSERIADRAAATQQALSAARLGSQGERFFTVLLDAIKQPTKLYERVKTAFSRDLERGRMDKSRILQLSGGVLLGGLIGWLLGNWQLRWSRKQRGRGGEPTLLTVLSRHSYDYLPLLLSGTIGTALLFIYFAPDATSSLLFRLAFALLAFSIARIIIRWLVGPYSPGANFLVSPELPGMIDRRLVFLVSACLLSVVTLGFKTYAGTASSDSILARAVVVLFICSALIWLVSAAREIPSMRGKLLPLRALLSLAAIASVVSEFAGYRNLTNHLITACLISLGAGLVLWTLLWLLKTLVRGLTHGTSALSYQMRSWMGMRPSETRSELGWLRLILSFALWIWFASQLISAWDTTGNLLPAIKTQLAQGIPLGGETTLVLTDMVIGLGTFGALLLLTAWIKARLSTRWLRDTGMDRGSREAVVTLSGYVGFVIAMIVGLTTAGVDFKSLALVVGALSLGIGFGLQNIVSNFVSGLILLFERPIKSGDYVSVGELEGSVKQIRIRSTEIETQDRQTVIVPNSELVATQVTNWVLHDSHGRLRLMIGVAYGSDTEKVREILQNVASEHPEVLTKGPTPKPRALFVNFGDSSLDFELRVWIRQIEKRYVVTSDINFAIDKAFREADIEIPFPQRDLHVKSWSNDVHIEAEQEDAQFEEESDTPKETDGDSTKKSQQKKEKQKNRKSKK
ncbi:MAG: mechanosensitive ion channel domain-containing protein [Gammaproteobacteria bacterium]